MRGNDHADGALTATRLRLCYDRVPVVEDASITLLPGRITALIGPNGSGKSTLLRSLARLHRPLDGTVSLSDVPDVLALSAKEFACRVTLLAQSRTTPHGVTVHDVVSYGRYPHRGRFRTDDPDGPRAIAWAMEVTGLTAMAGRGAEELSGGELQRVWLATCLAQDTGVLLLDEPTTYLDLRYQVEILDLVRDLADNHQVAIGLVLHDLNQAGDLADEVVLLHGGRIRAVGAPSDVMTTELLSDAYGIRIDVAPDPRTGRLVAQPIGRHVRHLQRPVVAV